MNRPKNQTELTENISFMAREELKDLEKLQKQASKKGIGVDEVEGYREPLSLDTEIEVKILLSWGGPSDGYKLYFNKDQELLRGVYWYADWGTYAENELGDDEVELVYQVYMYGDANSYFENIK